MPSHEQRDNRPHNPAPKRIRSFFARNSASNVEDVVGLEKAEEDKGRPTKWSMGVLNDPDTYEVPGTVLSNRL